MCGNKNMFVDLNESFRSFVNDNELSDENIVNFILFVNCDPITFEEVIKNDH